jgi:hypothetical protein
LAASENRNRAERQSAHWGGELAPAHFRRERSALPKDGARLDLPKAIRIGPFWSPPR